MLVHMIRHSLVRSARVTAWSLATLTAAAALATVFLAMAIDVGGKMTASLRRLGANAVAHEEDGREGAVSSRSGARSWSGAGSIVRAGQAELTELALRVGSIEGAPVAIVSADPGDLERMTPYWAVQGKRAVGRDECLLGQKVAKALGVALGSTLKARLDGSSEHERYRVVGTFESGDEDEGRMFVSRAPRPDEPRFTYGLVSAPGGEAGIESLNTALAAAGTGIVLTPLRQVLHGEQAVIGKINLLAGVALLAVLLLSAVGVSAAVLSRVIERRKELALLQAIGARRRAVVGFLLWEGATVGLAAAVLGYGAGILLSRAIVHQVFGVWATPHLAPFLGAVTVSLVISVLAAGIGARRALRMQTAVLLKGE